MAAAMMRSRVSSEIRDDVLAPLSTTDAAIAETPASRPTSASVAAWRTLLGFGDVVIGGVSDDGARSHHVGVVVGRQFSRAHLGGEVAVHDAEASLVAVFPFVVVDEGP